MIIRDAREDDLPGILAIYNHAVVTSTAIWNETEVDLANRADWLAQRRARGFPVLVAEAGHGVAGYGSYGDFRPFQGYRLTVEHSVYVREDARGHGHGRHLLLALIERARAAGLRVMVGAIAADNGPSLALHGKLGFVETGRMPGVGIKFGRFLDLVLMQRSVEG